MTIDELIIKWENDLLHSNDAKIEYSDYNQGHKLGRISQLVICLSELKNLNEAKSRAESEGK